MLVAPGTDIEQFLLRRNRTGMLDLVELFLGLALPASRIRSCFSVRRWMPWSSST